MIQGAASLSDLQRRGRPKWRLLPAITELMSEKAPQATFSDELPAL